MTINTVQFQYPEYHSCLLCVTEIQIQNFYSETYNYSKSLHIAFFSIRLKAERVGLFRFVNGMCVYGIRFNQIEFPFHFDTKMYCVLMCKNRWIIGRRKTRKSISLKSLWHICCMRLIKIILDFSQSEYIIFDKIRRSLRNSFNL